ncbi:AMP-binding protein, partial [Brucella sp. 21LCYQ03]|nr:AMP-binding protein [Brucella sp. 21LCYQ03]
MTVVDLVLRYPEEKGDETTLIFLDAYGNEKKQFTSRSLKESCLQAAYNLSSDITPKDITLLIAEDESDFVLAFFGCIMAGGIPAPLAPVRKSRNKHGYESILEILKRGQAKNVVIDEIHHQPLEEVLRQVSVSGVKVISVDSIKTQPATAV